MGAKQSQNRSLSLDNMIHGRTLEESNDHSKICVKCNIIRKRICDECPKCHEKMLPYTFGNMKIINSLSNL
jgi:primosomal protein N'